MGSYTIQIQATDDSRGIQGRTVIKSRHFPINGRAVTIGAGRGHISGKEPIVSAIAQRLQKGMSIKTLVNKVKSNRIIIEIGECDFQVIFRKEGNRYSLNGTQETLDTIFKALARVVLRSCYLDGSEESYDQLEDYLFRCLNYPENIMYVLENKVPFTFYERDGTNLTKHECRMNVKQIAPFEFALEVSSGVWGDIGLKDLNQFVDVYLYNKRKAKWWQISPQELYFKTVGVKPTPAQIKVMKEFLKQNRKQDIVEKRAMELFDDMVKNYDRIKEGMRERPGSSGGDKVKVMYIRGRIADWMLVDNCSKQGTQDVSTYILRHGDSGNNRGSGWNSNMTTKEKTMQKGLFWSGPICIDNMQSGASVGDQFASRAFACMNDTATLNLVSTLRGYFTEDMTKEKDTHKVRLDWDALP
tara:strand:+ start:16570 stop:17811 length:1242 start_codon:yes stop_codon:yes gene_type:complete